MVIIIFDKWIEVILLSDQVTKINHYEWGQLRGLIITYERIHTLQKTEIKRSISIKSVSGVSITIEGECDEFVIHV